MSCLPYLCLFVHVYSGGIYFVCRRAHVLFTLFVFVCTCILVVVSTLFVGGHMSCLPYLCFYKQSRYHHYIHVQTNTNKVNET
jgi:hypothetical protein